MNLDMRFKPPHLCIRALAGAALLATAARAAELGDITTRSFIGQPLAADIELVALSPEEVAGLQVRLAQADVYRGANVAMNPALASVRMAVVVRDRKQFLHVTTTRAVDAEYVHLYVALGAGGRQEVRLATVWLQPDPNPAPVPVAAPAPVSEMTAAQAEQIALRARAEREVAAKAAAAAAASAAAAAPVAAAVRDRTRPAPLPSVQESEVGAPGGLRAAAAARAQAPEAVRRAPSASVRDLPERIAGVLVSPRGTPLKPSASKEVATAEGAVPLGVAQALLPLPPLPLPQGVKRPAAAQASCAPAGISAKECVALDSHNAALSSKLVELEGKLKALQGAVGGKAASAGHGVPAGAAAKDASASGSASGRMESEAHAAKAPSASSAASTSEGGVAKVAPASASAASASGASASMSAASTSRASASASGASASGASASASAASASAASASASAAEGASAVAPAASVPVKQIRVLPKLKYKKEKPVEKPTDYTLPLAAGGVGLLALLGAGFIYLRRRKAGSGPLKIWQGFRKKKPEPEPLPEATPESLMQ
ncbi:type IV pilus assembly protein FimV [Duganella aceris]|uniref:FimV N-terminal domain-containing protein n=1 Tax=Duganella aceris TaxID=2703883 RepID=A0ABX0FT65_9BURK|nr:hypothetical protein [Duganella aceris]NGZ87725.1 hypothetical protein [Duganella aceris]